MNDSPSPRPPTLKGRLLAEASAWTRRTGRSRATLASRVAGDGKFFDRLGRGGDCTLSMYERFMAFFRADHRANAAGKIARRARKVPHRAKIP